VLSCSGVTKRFGGVTAVDHVDLELREGQILGLIGQNGAGKTTLFDCVSGFLRVDEGRIEVRGTENFPTAAGKKLDDLLVPAFATVREAAKRVLGQRPYDVQLVGGDLHLRRRQAGAELDLPDLVEDAGRGKTI